MLEIKNVVVVVAHIFLKHNGLCEQTISSSQLHSQSILHTNFRACLTSLACTLNLCMVRTMHTICEALEKDCLKKRKKEKGGKKRI